MPNNQNGWLEIEPEVPARKPEIDSDTSTITDVGDWNGVDSNLTCTYVDLLECES